MRVEAALGICEDVDFDLAHARVQLRGEGRMTVIKPRENVGILFLPVLLGARRKAAVIAVVGADYLNLIDANIGVGLRNGVAPG